MHLYTDSVCVYQLLMNNLTGKTQVRTKAASEMLVCWRLANMQQLIEEYTLVVDVKLTTSEKNLADRLTRVPKRWLDSLKQGSEPLTCTVLTNQLTNEQIRVIHNKCRHPGIQCMTYFTQRVFPAVTKAMVRLAIQGCEECFTVDPALVQWKKGKLRVDRNWWQLGLDVTHYDSSHFLSLTDCTPMRFTLWCPLAL